MITDNQVENLYSAVIDILDNNEPIDQINRSAKRLKERMDFDDRSKANNNYKTHNIINIFLGYLNKKAWHLTKSMLYSS